jgi:hypothetical protein
MAAVVATRYNPNVKAQYERFPRKGKWMNNMRTIMLR